MSERYRIGLCHPRLIGMFYKDSFLKVFFYLISLILIYTGICAITTYGNDNFTYDDARKITQVIYENESSDILFDAEADKITGTPVKFTSGALIVNFLLSENYSNTTGTVIRFKEEKVEVLYKGYIVGEVLYSSINVEGFKLADVKAGNDKAVSEFMDMIDFILEDVNLSFSTINLANAVINDLANLFMVFIFCVLSSFFTNPSIGLKIRIKLSVYCIGIYYIAMTLAVLFNAAWMQYAALILPLIYVYITFSHIIKVEKKKVGGES